MNVYLDLLRTAGVGRIIAAQLAARLPSGMLALGLLLHIEGIFHSYGAAGVVLAAMSVGQAISGPLLARWMGQWAIRPVLLITTLISTAGIVVMALAPLPLWGFVATSLLIGLSFPPVQPAVRTIYPKLVNSRQLTPLFSLDASAQEIIWIAGPVVVTFIGTQISTVVGVLMSAAFMLGGGLWFLLSPEVGSVRIPRSKRRFGKVLFRPTVLIATLAGTLVIASCAAIETGVVATFGEGGAEASLVLALWGVASFGGGLAFGNVGISKGSMARRLLITAVGCGLAIVAWEFWSLTAALIIAGIGLAPALTVMFATVSATVKFSDTTEAYGWVGTGQLMGAAIGSAIAGFIIDGIGENGAFIAAAGFASAAALIAALAARALPDLRGRDASPLADTEPVPLTPS